MSDFEAALKASLERNDELARERQQAEHEMDRVLREREETFKREAEETRRRRTARHGELVEHLTKVARDLKDAAPEAFVVRVGWTESGEEFIAKLSTRLLQPARSLLIELDRDDDEVLARWHSDVGNALELWHLLEVEGWLLERLVLQVADQDLWRGRSAPPPFPSPDA